MTTRPGRNAPCPCGSGKKYKQCHRVEDARADDATTRGRRLGSLSAEVTLEAFEFAAKRFGDALRAEAFEPFITTHDAMQLLVPCAVYHVEIEGRPVADWYRERQGSKLSNDARACLDAEREAWLSLWEVVETHPGERLVLRDRLSGEERVVEERTASRSLVPLDTVLARVVEVDGFVSINGLYPRALAPLLAADVERRARGRLRRKRNVPVDRLRDPAFVRYLIRRVEEAVFEQDEVLPELVNNDGDPILLTRDHFDLAPDAAREVERRLRGVQGVELAQIDDGDVELVFLGRGDIVVGNARLGRAGLRVETNSRERADRLRARIEKTCGPLVVHRIREYTDPLSEVSQPDGSEAAPPGPAEADATLAFKGKYYQDWIDQPVPALDGETPREAAQTAEGRARLADLLAEFEHSEQRQPPSTRFDFGPIRRVLGLDR